MSELTLFYSWQSDLPRKLSRDLIHSAAADAITRLHLDASIEDAPRLDHDTQGTAGAPEVAGTIFEKIDRCGLFLADVGFVGATTPNSSGKPTKKLPNPNVLLELGYAAARIGWGRVILVMNTKYGSTDDLIFDLRHRRHPITFSLGDEDRAKIPAIAEKLSVGSPGTELEFAL